MKKLPNKMRRFVAVLLSCVLTLGTFGVLPVSAAEEDAPFTYLSDLNWKSAASGWKSVLKDKNVNGGALKMMGVTYEKGLGTHSASTIVYELGGKYGRFTSMAGLDDGKRTADNCAGITLQVWCDGEKTYESPFLGKNSSPVFIDVDVNGVNELKLVVLDNDGINTSSWTDWADAKLYEQTDPAVQLNGLFIDGAPVENFKPTTYRYKLALTAEDANNVPVPKITATASNPDATVEIAQAPFVPGKAVVTVTAGELKGVYEVEFSVKDIVFLSDLGWDSATQGWAGKTVQKDKNIGGGPINLLGTQYNKGLGTFANSSIKYNLGGKYIKFQTNLGVDYEQKDRIDQSLIFSIKCDGVERYKSSPINHDDQGWGELIEVNVENVQTLELIVSNNGNPTDGDWADWAGARLVEGEPTGTLLTGIQVDGKTIEGFAGNITSYDVKLNAGTIQVPEVTVQKQDEAATVEITPAAGLPGQTVITVAKGENRSVYYVNFTIKDAGLDEIELTIDNNRLNPLLNENEVGHLSTKVLLGTGEQLDPDDPRLEMTYSVQTLKTSGDLPIASVDQSGVVTPLKNESYVEEGMETAWLGGTARATVSVTVDGRTMTDTVDFTIRPFYLDYSQTIVMKMDMHMNGGVTQNFEQALEIIKKYDQATRGIPKVVYLVGWQTTGHDTGYPSWDQVDESLANPGMTARDSLIWLMNEGKKYNTTVSLHLNMTTCFPNSPLYNEYFSKDILGRYSDGGLSVYGGSSVVSYYRDWQAGMIQRRIDRLLEMYPPLAEGHTIHSDAFHVVIPSSTTGNGKEAQMSELGQKQGGYTQADEVDSMRKIFQYWRSRGLDLTSEFVDSYRKGEAFIGLQPMAWHFRQTSKDWNMGVPACLYTGGDGGDERYGVSYTPEGNLKPGSNNERNWLGDFAQTSLPWAYLNTLDRISDDGTTVQFSGGVTSASTANGIVIKEGDKVLREGDNLFIPAVWQEHREIIAFSEKGYQNRTWSFPDEWEGVEKADVYQITPDGLREVGKDVDISGGTITLTLAADTGYSIVPAKTDVSEASPSVSKIELSDDALTMNAGEEHRISAAVLPANAKDKGVRFSSSNEAVAKVANSGIVTAMTPGTAVITATTTDGGKLATCTVQVAGSMEKVGNPTSDHACGSYDGPIRVKLTSTTEGADIFYTIDGTTPTELSTYYSEKSPVPAPIHVDDDVTIKAVAMKDGMRASDIMTYTYQIKKPVVSAPIANAPADHYSSSQAVVLYSSTVGSTIYYTLDGSEPTTSSIRYNHTSPIMITGPTDIKAIAVKDGMPSSEVVAYHYDFTYQTAKNNTPNTSVPVGVYSGPVTIELTSNTPGAEIRYTTNGSRPGSSSTLYTGPITLNESTTLKVYATKGKGDSDVALFNYIIATEAAQAPTAIFTEKENGQYTVELKTETADADILFTTNGDIPFTCYPLYGGGVTYWRYDGPITVEKGQVVRAMTVKKGLMDSELITFTDALEGESPADKRLLFETIEAAKQAKENYMPNLIPAVREKFEAALKEAQRIYDLSTATQAQVNAADDALILMLQYLSFTADLEGFDKAIQNAKDIVASGKYADDEYMDAFKKALEDAIALRAEEIITDTEISRAIQALLDAQENLNEAEITLNTKDLERELSISEKIDLTLYLDNDAKKAFAEALQGAQTALKQAAALEITQTDIDNAVIKLHAARIGLRLIPSKDALEKLINEAKTIDLSMYTEKSADTFLEALDYAVGVLQEPLADEHTVAAAQKKLLAAKDALVPIKPNTDAKPSDGGENGKEPAGKTPTGDHTPITMLAVLLLMSGAALTLPKRKNEDK